MAFCGNCGTMVQEGSKFCQACGTAAVTGIPPVQPVQPVQPAPPVRHQQGYQQPPVGQQGYQQPPAWQQQGHQQPTAWQQQGYQQPPVRQQQGYQPPVMPGAPAQADIRDAQDNKTMAILAYILFFIPLLTGAHRESPFAKFHTNQGTVLFLASLALSVVVGVISTILTAIFAAAYAAGALLTVTGIFSVVWLVCGVGITVLAVVGIINAANGRMKPLPLIGGITIIR